jgi:hypothetical protein
LNNIKWGFQLCLWQPSAAESEGDNIEMDLFPSVTNMDIFMLIPKQSYHITVLQIILMKVQVLWCWVIGHSCPAFHGIILPLSSWFRQSKTTCFGLPDACRWRHSDASKFYIHVTVHRNEFLFNNQPDALIIQIYSVIKLYMFRASSLPIIRSFLL